MTKQEARATLEFLMRVQLQAQEAEAFIVCKNALIREMNKEEKKDDAQVPHDS